MIGLVTSLVDGGLTAGYLTHWQGADYAVHSLATPLILPVGVAAKGSS